MKKTAFVVIILSTISLTISAQSIDFPLKNSIDSVSYALGLNVAAQIQNQGIEKLNPEKVAEAIAHYYEGIDPLILPAEASSYFNNYLQNQKQMLAKSNLAASMKFLEENKNKEGITELPSGLQYKILKKGTGPIPKKGQKVTAHYTGKLANGTIFDSSVQRGKPFSVKVGTGRVIKGWDEVLQLMPVGSKWEIYLPPNLAYGVNPRPGSGIEPNDLLIFELELLSIDQ